MRLRLGRLRGSSRGDVMVENLGARAIYQSFCDLNSIVVCDRLCISPFDLPLLVAQLDDPILPPLS